MAESGAIRMKEVLPKVGMIHRATYHERHLEAKHDTVKEDPRVGLAIDMVLCKPKLLPMKSVTLEKLDKMQKDAQETVKQQEMEALGHKSGIAGMAAGMDGLEENQYDLFS